MKDFNGDVTQVKLNCKISNCKFFTTQYYKSVKHNFIITNKKIVKSRCSLQGIVYANYTGLAAIYKG